MSFAFATNAARMDGINKNTLSRVVALLLVCHMKEKRNS